MVTRLILKTSTSCTRFRLYTTYHQARFFPPLSLWRVAAAVRRLAELSSIFLFYSIDIWLSRERSHRRSTWIQVHCDSPTQRSSWFRNSVAEGHPRCRPRHRDWEEYWCPVCNTWGIPPSYTDKGLYTGLKRISSNLGLLHSPCGACRNRSWTQKKKKVVSHHTCIRTMWQKND